LLLHPLLLPRLVLQRRRLVLLPPPPVAEGPSTAAEASLV